MSPLKDRIVSNSRLFKAAVDFGLDRYIIHKAFALQKWRPTYVEDLLANPPPATETRQLSTKILADVVEALIGTSFISGGIPKAISCLSLFLPDFEWHSLERGREILYNEAPADEPLPVTMRELESLIGYTFTKKSLLVEAMTHPSCTGPGVRASLDRLEFLGDAILDYIVVTTLYNITTPAPLPNHTLHLLKTALVNADILAFLVMEWSLPQDRIDATSSAPTHNNHTHSHSLPDITLTPTTTHLPRKSTHSPSTPPSQISQEKHLPNPKTPQKKPTTNIPPQKKQYPPSSATPPPTSQQPNTPPPSATPTSAPPSPNTSGTASPTRGRSSPACSRPNSTRIYSRVSLVPCGWTLGRWKRVRVCWSGWGFWG